MTNARIAGTSFEVLSWSFTNRDQTQLQGFSAMGLRNPDVLVPVAWVDFYTPPRVEPTSGTETDVDGHYWQPDSSQPPGSARWWGSRPGATEPLTFAELQTQWGPTTAIPVASPTRTVR